MNTVDRQTTPPAGDMAAEYVLGVLDRGERREAQERMARDAGFAREVALWESRFMPLLDKVAAVPVPGYVWARILSALDLPPSASTRTAVRPGPWQSLSFWRWLAGGAFATAATFALVLFMARPVVVKAPIARMASTLADDNGVPGFVAVVDLTTASMTITPLAGAPTDGRAQELWLIPQGQAPLSLGLLDATRAQVVRIPDSMLADVGADAVFAVTLESPQGAPHAAPAGPVIAKGGIALL